MNSKQILSHVFDQDRQYDYTSVVSDSILPCDSEDQKNELREKIVALYEFCKSNQEQEERNLIRWTKFSTTKILYFQNKKLIPFEKVQITSSRVGLSYGAIATIQKCEFTFKEELNLFVENYFLMGNLINDCQIPLGYLSGRELEVISIDNDVGGNIKDWTNWKAPDPQAVSTYQIIHSLFEMAIARIYRNLKREFLEIIDIGGGEGDLAISLCKYKHVRKVHLVDNHTDSLIKAQSKIANICATCQFNNRHHQVYEKLRIHKRDITSPQLFEEKLNRKVDVITLSGVVAQLVLTKMDSQVLLRRCSEHIKDDGYICIASYTFCHFSKSEFETMGFAVRNMTSCYTRSLCSSPNDIEILVEPFYILQKSLQPHSQ